MKQALMTAAIIGALALAGTPAHATETQAAEAFASWSIQAPPQAQKIIDDARQQIDAAPNDPQSKGAAVATALRQGGLLSAIVSVRPGNIIQVSLARPVFDGEYASYFPQGEYLTKRQLEAGATKASNRAKADGKAVSIQVGAPDPATGTVAVSAVSASVEDWQRWSASVGFNNYGSRYSGSDLVTAYGRVALEDGNEAYASFAHGLANTTPDSYGGRYNAASVGWAHHGEHGTTRIEFSNAVWTAGGPVRVFDLTGRVTSFSVGHWIPLDAKWAVFGQLSHTQNRQHLGVVGWKDQTNYTTARIGVERTTPNSRLTVSVEQGLGGSRDFNAVPLLGEFDPNYTTAKIDWEGKRALGDDGWVLRGRAGGHVGSSDTPSNELFSAGGPGRGRAWLTGSTSGKRGAYGEVVVEAPQRNGFTPYFGVDTAIVDPAIGPSSHLSSAFVGTRYNRGRFHVDAGYAHGIGGNDLAGQQKDSRVFISAGYRW